MAEDCDFELPAPNLGKHNGQGLQAFVVEMDRRSVALALIHCNVTVCNGNIEIVGCMIYLYNCLKKIADKYSDGAARRFALSIKAVIEYDLSGEVDYYFPDNCFYGVQGEVERFLDQMSFQDDAGIEWQPKVKFELLTIFRNNFEHFAGICTSAARKYETARHTESFETQQECLGKLIEAQIEKTNCTKHFLEYLLNFVCNTSITEKLDYVETKAKGILRTLTEPDKTNVESEEGLKIEMSRCYHAYVQAHRCQLGMLRD